MMLIAIEGIDGSGKRTQANKLAQRLADLDWERAQKNPKAQAEWPSGYKGVSLFSFPAYEHSWLGPVIKQYLKGEFGSIDDVPPFLTSLLFSVERFEKRQLIKHHLDNCKCIVVCDRYTPSNVAHQAGKLYIQGGTDWQKLAQQVETVEYEILGMPRPDLVIYFDLTADQSYARTHARDTEVDIHQDNRQYLSQVREVYLHYVNTYKAWHLVKCFDSDGKPRSVDEIHDEVYKIFRAACATQ